MPSIRVVVNTAKLDEIIARLPEVDGVIADLAARQVEEHAKQVVPVRSGFLRASIGRRVDGGGWVVEAGAFYSAFVELGTRFMSARPYLRPALESVNWADILRQAFKAIGF